MTTIPRLSELTGYSTYTVSCALRGVGSVAPKTRQLILEEAARHGYRPSSAASLLARQRHRKINEAQQEPVAMVGDFNDESGEAFSATCAALGLEGRVARLRDGARVPREVERLWQAGVKGLYLRAMPETALAFEAVDLSRFAVVKESRAYPALRFHIVRLSAFDFMLETLRRVFDAGYRRVAVVSSSSVSEHDDLARFGAIAAFQQRLMPRGASLRLFPVDQGPGGTDGRVIERVRRHRPEAIVGFPFTWFYEFRDAGVAIPEEAGFATVLAYRGLRDTPQISGCDAADIECIRRAATRLYTLLQSRETGFAANPTEDVIEPVWMEGETLGTTGR